VVRFVVMAAGLATRMGRDKLALPWKNTTVLGYVLETVREAIERQDEATEIFVIARQPMESYCAAESIHKFNLRGETWLQVPKPVPLSETIRLSLQNLKNEIRGIGFLPGDQVGVTVQGLGDCLKQVRHGMPDFLVPTAGGIAGSPVFFHKRYVPELLALQGEQGGREVLYRYPERWRNYPVEESLFNDVDTPEQYSALFGKL